MKVAVLCLCLLGACVSPTSESDSKNVLGVSAGLPFRVAVLPVLPADSNVRGQLDLSGAAQALAASFAKDLFVQAAFESSISSALQSDAELILVPQAFLRVEGESEVGTAFLNARFYDAGFPEEWSGAFPTGQAGLVLSIETPVIGNDWEGAASELEVLVRSRSDSLLNSGLAPFALKTSELSFRRRGARLELTGTIEFTAGSRSRRVRSVRCTLPDGATLEAELSAGVLDSRSAPFTVDLPQLESGDLLLIQVETGSRVRYLRRYAVRLR